MQCHGNWNLIAILNYCVAVKAERWAVGIKAALRDPQGKFNLFMLTSHALCFCCSELQSNRLEIVVKTACRWYRRSRRSFSLGSRDGTVVGALVLLQCLTRIAINSLVTDRPVDSESGSNWNLEPKNQFFFFMVLKLPQKSLNAAFMFSPLLTLYSFDGINKSAEVTRAYICCCFFLSSFY